MKIFSPKYIFLRGTETDTLNTRPPQRWNRGSSGMGRCRGGWVNQAYSQLSTTRGHITDCKLDSVVYAWWFNVDLSCLGQTIYTRQCFWGANSTTGEQKGITHTIYTDSEPPSRMPNSLMPIAKLRSANLPFFTSLVWSGRVSNPDSGLIRMNVLNIIREQRFNNHVMGQANRELEVLV